MMKLTQVRGNTWVIEAMALIPFYKLDSRRVIQSIQLMKSLGGGYQAGPVVEKK